MRYWGINTKCVGNKRHHLLNRSQVTHHFFRKHSVCSSSSSFRQWHIVSSSCFIITTSSPTPSKIKVKNPRKKKKAKTMCISNATCKTSSFITKLFANLMIMWVCSPQVYFDVSDGVFLTFSVFPLQVSDLQPGWFLWGGNITRPEKMHRVILSTPQSGRDKLNIHL